MSEKVKGRGKGKPFVKGDPRAGRPKGALNKATLEIKEMARKFIEDPEGLETTLSLYRQGKLNPSVHVAMLHYAYGKPKETVEVSNPDGGPIAVIERVIVRAGESK